MDKKDFFDRLIMALQNIREKYDLKDIHDALILWFAENYLYYDPSYEPTGGCGR